MFEIKDNKVFSYGKLVPGADAESFEALNQNWGRDATTVYYQTYKVEDINKDSIVVLDDYSVHDEQNVFQHGSMLEGCGIDGLKILSSSHVVSHNGVYFQRSKINEADPESFVSLGIHHGKDKSHVYYLRDPMPAADYASFRTLETSYAMDKHHVYHGNTILNDADRESFVALPDPIHDYFAYALDDNQVYYEGGIIPDADPKTFRVIKEHYSADANQVFHFNEAITGADPKTFRVLEDATISEIYIDIISLCCDINWIYYNQQQLQPYDESFEYLGGCYYHYKSRIYYLSNDKPLDFVDIASFSILSASIARDKHHVYFDRRYLSKCDPDSFEVLNSYWSRDTSHVYRLGELMPELDVATFHSEDDGYWARDNKHLYLDGDLVEDADAASFEHIGGDYYRDCRHIFYYHRHHHILDKVEFADRHSFEYLGNDIFGCDATHAFYYGAIIEGSHAASFEILEYSFSADKNFYYHGSDILCERKLGEFRRIRYHGAIVGKVFFEDDEQVLIDPASFSTINDDYSKDKSQVIFRGQIVDGADPNSFTRINETYYCDNSGVFCYSQKLQLDINEVNFEHDCFAYDSHRLYFIDEQVEGVDIPSLTCLEGQYCKDKYSVYRQTERIEGADPTSFRYYNYSEARDNNYRYFMRQGELKREKL